MYLKERSSGDLIEVLNMKELIDPNLPSVSGRYHHGEELQDPEAFEKSGLIFPSGEELPRCWIDLHYRDAEY